jgi:type II secretory pathway pseudopilin PulG
MYKVKGFTLFELMLIIAVASVLTVGALSMVRIRSKHVVADQTVIVIQQWLQAAIAYYADNQTLPQDSEKIKAVLQGHYMPDKVGTLNAWGEPYVLSFDGKMITVKTLVPADVGSLLQSSLPLASLTDSNARAGKKELSVHAPAPTSSDSSTIQFAEIIAGSEEKPYFVPEPSCPADMKAEVFATPVTYGSGVNSYPIVQVGAYAKVYTDEQGQKGWQVFSTLYTVKGSALRQVGNDEYTKYNNILVMTKCTKQVETKVVADEVLGKFPISFK